MLIHDQYFYQTFYHYCIYVFSYSLKTANVASHIGSQNQQYVPTTYIPKYLRNTYMLKTINKTNEYVY